MKTFEQFKMGYKAQSIELAEFQIEGMSSEEIIALAQQYPNCQWDTCDNIQSNCCGYTTITRPETSEETLARAKSDYEKYVAREKEKAEIDQQLKVAQLQIAQMEKDVEMTRQKLANLKSQKRRIEDSARGYSLNSY